MRENVKYINIAALQLAKRQEAELRATEQQIRRMDRAFLTLLLLAAAISAVIVGVN